MNTLAVVDGPRACRSDELTEMIALANSVMRDGSDQSFLTDYPLVYTAENLHNVQVMKAADTIVSVVPYIPKQIAYAGTHFQIGIISPTATHPEHRRLGHARRCLDSCISLMESAGIELSVLWTLPATFPFYEQAGFQAVLPQMDWVHCTKDDALIFQDRGHRIDILDRTDSGQLQAIENLHGNDLCGVIRSSRDTKALFSLPRTTTYLAYDDAGEVSGYLLSCTGSHKPGVLEAEGSPEAIESLMHHTLMTSELQRTPVYLPKNESTLSMLAQQRVSARIQPMEAGPMMVRINRPLDFVRSIHPWLQAQCIGERYSCSLEINDAQQVIGFDYDPNREKRLILTHNKMQNPQSISRRELTALLFGSGPDNPTALNPIFHQRAHFSFPIPMLDHS